MSAVSKTKKLKRIDLPITSLIKNTDNPNKMDQRSFDLLVDNIEATGITDPILVRDLGKGKYRIIGGHHRFDAAVYLGFKDVPCTVIDDPEFDEDLENFQVVRMNMIRGKLDAVAFMTMFEKVADKYSEQVLQEAFGFASQAEFKKLITQTAKSLPTPLMKEKFTEAAKEVKTIDGIAKLLNTIFTKYGDTVPNGFMVLDYGGADQIWIGISTKTFEACKIIGTMCVENSRTMDDVLGKVVQMIAKGELKEVTEKLLSETPVKKLPKGLQTLPTQANIDSLAKI